MNKFLQLLVVALAPIFVGADTLLSADMMFVFSMSNAEGQRNSSSSLAGKLFDENKPGDFIVLVGNVSSSEAWINSIPGYAEAAGGRTLFQTASWFLLEDGAQHNAFSSFWARFQANSSPDTIYPLSICAMVVEWEEASWSENRTTAAAVELGIRLRDKCGNDTIALSFSAPVSKTVLTYLEGDNTASTATAPLALSGVGSSLAAAVEPLADHLVFVRLADKMCVNSASTPSHSSESQPDPLLLKFSDDKSCFEPTGSPSSASSHNNDSSSSSNSSNSDSDWESSLRFIIPICCCTFLLGCASLVYVLLQKKPYHASETPKDDKEFATKLPYVLTLHPVI